MRGTFRSQQKLMPFFIPRSAVVGATDGATPASIALTIESEVNKHGIRNCIRRGRDDGLVCVDSRALPAWRVNAISTLSCLARIGGLRLARVWQEWRLIIQAGRKPTHVYPPVLPDCPRI